MRAWDKNTSIDPSDTPENMSKFLSCLGTALDASQPGHQDTTVRLAPGSTSESGQEDGITVQVSCKLPGFPDLKWPFHLSLNSSSRLATELVMPMAEALYTRHQEMEALIEALKQKDSVISKLSDKLEATGTGLEHVFTALASRKNVPRSVAEDKIKGLAPFDERKWKSSLGDVDEPDDINQLIQTVFESSSIPQRSAHLSAQSSKLRDSWWQNFRPTTGLAIRDKEAKSEVKTPSPPPAPATANDDDDEFQVQSTPPHLKSSSKRDTASTASTKRESPTPETPSSKSSERPKKPSGKLGAIGGKKKASPAPKSPTPTKSSSPAPAPPESAPSAMDIDGDETASETASDTDADETASLPDEVPSSPPAKPAAKKGGLGRIGGGARQSTAPKDEKAEKDADATTATNATTSASASAAPRKLGVIGNKPKPSGDTAPDAVDGDAERGRAVTREQDDGKQQQQQQARETSQERADRKRDELKRDLEKKAAAGPAKKKRRF